MLKLKIFFCKGQFHGIEAGYIGKYDADKNEGTKIGGFRYGRIGSALNKNTRLDVPNTLLKKDICELTEQPTKKVLLLSARRLAERKLYKKERNLSFLYIEMM